MVEQIRKFVLDRWQTTKLTVPQPIIPMPSMFIIDGFLSCFKRKGPAPLSDLLIRFVSSCALVTMVANKYSKRRRRY
jgi:hypothetical protein